MLRNRMPGGKHGRQQPESRVRTSRAATAGNRSTRKPKPAAAIDSATLAAEQSHTVTVRTKALAPPKPCFKCGGIGSFCTLCKASICHDCNKNPHLGDGHTRAAHLKAPVESEHDRLTRENASLQLALDRRARSNIRVSPDLEAMRAKNAELKAALGPS
jgi:hypothetical protein